MGVLNIFNHCIYWSSTFMNFLKPSPQWPRLNHDVERCWADPQWNPCWCHPISMNVSIGVARHQLILSGLPLSSDRCHIPIHTELSLFSFWSANTGASDHGTSLCFPGAWRIWRDEPHPRFSSWGLFFIPPICLQTIVSLCCLGENTYTSPLSDEDSP